MLVEFEFLSGERVWFCRSYSSDFYSANIGTIDKISLVNYKNKWYFEVELTDFSWFTEDKFVNSWARRENIRTSKKHPTIFRTYEELLKRYPDAKH